MKYADYTRNTKDPFKKIAHSRRLEQAARLSPLSADMEILDYGCGDGALFEHLEKFVPAGNLFGFDPELLAQVTFKSTTTYEDAKTLVAEHSEEFDVVYCMEVCEHLNYDAPFALFRNIRVLGKSDATVIFGIPLETGVSGFVKNM